MFFVVIINSSTTSNFLSGSRKNKFSICSVSTIEKKKSKSYFYPGFLSDGNKAVYGLIGEIIDLSKLTNQSQSPIPFQIRKPVEQVCREEAIEKEIALRCRTTRGWSAYLNNISAWSEQIQTVGQIRIIYFTQIQYK